MIRHLLETKEYELLIEMLNGMLLEELIDMLSELEEDEKLIVFGLLHLPVTVKTFVFLDSFEQKFFVHALSSDKVRKLSMRWS